MQLPMFAVNVGSCFRLVPSVPTIEFAGDCRLGIPARR